MVPNKVKTSKLFEDLRKFRFQKKQGISNLEAIKNDNVSNESNSHYISDSDDNSGSFSSQTSSHMGNSKNGESNNIAHLISDSENDSQQPAKKSRIKNRAALQDSDDESDKCTKRYSRIKRKLSGSDSSTNSENDNRRKSKSPTSHKKSPHSRNGSDHKSPSKSATENSQTEHGVKRKFKFKASKDCIAKRAKADTDFEEMFWSDTVVKSDEEDSDSEISNVMTPTKEKVFNFINTGTKLELLQVPSWTEKKVNCVLELRPFKQWKQMVMNFKTSKNITPQLLNTAVEFLKTRDIVSNLMRKCLDLTILTEKAILENSAILKTQPLNISKDLTLKSYQMIGLNWLAVMHRQKLNGILADEMGLGKTMQVIAFLAYLKDSRFSKQPHLIVVPASILDNWAIEFTRWCPDLRLVTYHGNAEERRSLRYFWFKDRYKSMDVILTTYNILSGNPFKKVKFHYVIFDEAHMLKNMNTQRYFQLFNINAHNRILLTGTPLQNNLLELMSLLNFVMPDMFSQKIQYIKSFFSKNSKLSDSTITSFEEAQINLAKRIMKPFVLRRLKDDVLRDLPKKTSSVIYCPLLMEQKVKYDGILEEVQQWNQTKEEGYSFMSYFTQLRKMANHPLTCRYLYQDDQLKEIASRLATDYDYKETNEQNILEEIMYMSDHEIHTLTKDYKSISKFKLTDSLFLNSGKFQKLDELLPKLKADGHRVVMFSQFVFVLNLLEEYMRIKDYSFLRLDGQTNILDRQELIDNFNEDSEVFVFLLTTRAGGVGINLTTADTVIIHDIDFNPYNDKQAEDRCHRLGQTRPVTIYRFISEGTVEEKIYSLAQSKLELEQDLTSSKDDVDSGQNVELLLKEVLGFEK